jgi:hypothetical protein
LKEGTAKLLQETIKLPSIRKDETGDSPEYFWCIVDMMLFENIGFTKTQHEKRYLACAECDLGISLN